MNTSEIWSNIERELLGLKWIGNTTMTVDPLQKEPQVGRGLFGIRLLILHFKFQFSKTIKSSTFHIFLNLTYPLRKNISFPKHPKITQKFTQNRQIVVNERNLASLETWPRYWQKGRVKRRENSLHVYPRLKLFQNYVEFLSFCNFSVTFSGYRFDWC